MKLIDTEIKPRGNDTSPIQVTRVAPETLWEMSLLEMCIKSQRQGYFGAYEILCQTSVDYAKPSRLVSQELQLGQWTSDGRCVVKLRVYGSRHGMPIGPVEDDFELDDPFADKPAPAPAPLSESNAHVSVVYSQNEGQSRGVFLWWEYPSTDYNQECADDEMLTDFCLSQEHPDFDAAQFHAAIDAEMDRLQRQRIRDDLQQRASALGLNLGEDVSYDEEMGMFYDGDNWYPG